MFTAWPAERTPTNRTGTEREILTSLIEFHRETVIAKCSGLSDEQLKTKPIPGSPHTLLGLIRHLTYVELYWGSEVVGGMPDSDVGYIYGMEDNDADFFDIDSHPVAEVESAYLDSIKRAREFMAGADFESILNNGAYGKPISLRFIYMHYLEEYARHCGHIDMLREALDGKIGY